MIKKLLAFGLWILLISSINTVLADEDDDEKDIKSAGKSQALVLKAAKAMGGLEKIKSVKLQQTTATGARFAPEQSFSPGGDPVHLANYEYTLWRGFKNRMSRVEWSLNIFYPLVAQRNYTEIINKDYGAVIGVDTILEQPQAPMVSTRIGARTKQHLVSSPLALLRHALDNLHDTKYLGKAEFNGKKHRIVSIPGWDQPIRLFINKRTNLPSKAETIEDETVYGDVLWEVLFDSWADVDGIMTPFEVTYRLNGNIINHETRNAVIYEKQTDETLFVIPDSLKSALDPELFAWGIRSSQWFTRLIPAGIPFDLDQSKVETVFIDEIAPKVFHARAFTHHTLIVEMKDFLVAVDPVLYEQRTQAVLSVVRERWPNKPVKYIIASHFHSDHIGGVRGYAAEGATLVVGATTEAHYEKILEAPHTVYPDSLAISPREVDIKTVAVDEEFLISDGTRIIKVFDLANSHATGTLIPYIVDAKLVFVSDLYNPELFPAPIPPVFSHWAPDLLIGLERSGLDVDWLAGAHGGVTSYEQFVADVNASN